MLGVLLGALLPLMDPDFPMHLAVGEWIVRERAVPFVEPFAWTRQGAPYYAYSWLPQTVFYLVHAAFGPLGLRVLQGVLLMLAAGSVVFLGRSAGWRSGTIVCLAPASVIATVMAVPALRPQIMLAVIMPALWALYYRGIDGERRVWPSALAVILLSAVLANSHLFFVMSLAPVCLFWVHRVRSLRRMVILVGATLLGWCLSPYGLHWPDVFRTNFAPNAMISWPSPIAELMPGFHALTEFDLVNFVPLAALLSAPWLLAGRGLERRHIVAAAAYWVAGLVGFGYAVRLQIVWWLLFLPFAGRILDLISADQVDAAPRLRFRVAGYSVIVLVSMVALSQAEADWRREGTVKSRRLAANYARGLEPLAGWLDDHTRPEARGRLYTIFNYGSYATWRLPRFSSSIDTRTIFPDSVALAESYQDPGRHMDHNGPWQSADVAVVPFRYRVAAVLDTATGWRRAAVATLPPGVATKDTVGLWVRMEWWERAGRAPLSTSPALLLVGSGYDR